MCPALKAHHNLVCIAWAWHTVNNNLTLITGAVIKKCVMIHNTIKTTVQPKRSCTVCLTNTLLKYGQHYLNGWADHHDCCWMWSSQTTELWSDMAKDARFQVAVRTMTVVMCGYVDQALSFILLTWLISIIDMMIGRYSESLLDIDLDPMTAVLTHPCSSIHVSVEFGVQAFVTSRTCFALRARERWQETGTHLEVILGVEQFGSVVEYWSHVACTIERFPSRSVVCVDDVIHLSSADCNLHTWSRSYDTIVYIYTSLYI